MSLTRTPMLWLLKAEPDSRIVKGKDVKFSVDDFESVKTSPWEGVRNYEARNLMKEMKSEEQESFKACFWDGRCAAIGIAAFAEVSTEAYPDHTAWDSSHPYYDPKSDKSSPKWFMVDLTFKSRAQHFVSLTLLKYISEHVDDLPEELEYIGSEGAKAIKGMDLINRGRLSVQRIQKPVRDVIKLLAERGGWDELMFGKGKGKSKGAGSGNVSKNRKNKGKESTREEDVESEDQREENEKDGYNQKSPPGKADGKGKGRKRKAEGNEHVDQRPATRARTRS
ncbi:EVE domain-containing protein [Lentinula guzmanii]|uniref:EVE domain-containing protein n=1 Tax=Lentinula guzmanii TaxID=2804957 RepID=A0AA38JJ73_9AGAR|nr:EVE domain-containing protein [Lentinula guzmanii]